ncbi:MAG TPA: AAA family ATPase [Acidimicrobiales bacterium]|nr:AAA family ATPase [Acidimicrobiales bacterium]
MAHDALVRPVGEFIDEIAPLLLAVAKTTGSTNPARLADDVVLEAQHLVAACIDADGRHTDDEMWAYLAALGPRSPTVLAYATPQDLRDGELIDGRATWVERPSTLFDVLVAADRRDGGRRAHTYYDHALRVAHTVCSLDAVASSEELAAIDRLRRTLLDAMTAANVARPGVPHPHPQPATGGSAVSPASAEKPPVEVLAPARPVEDLLAELDALIGLAGVKAEVRLVADLLQVQAMRRERDLPVPDTSRHLVFTGNPGTGKTTVARLLAQIYRSLGVVEKGHLVETDRAGLVAGFVGQTALKTSEVFTSALGGVLLVDEAYALARGDDGRDFGREAIDTLVKLVEDHRDDIVVIVAGYPEEMGTFVDSNPGLRSRFPRTIHFPDYDDDELVAIFKSLCKSGGYTVPSETEAALLDWFAAQPRTKGFGNGRLARNLFEAAMARQASRIVAGRDDKDAPALTDDDLMRLTPTDVSPPADGVPGAP